MHFQPAISNPEPYISLLSFKEDFFRHEVKSRIGGKYLSIGIIFMSTRTHNTELTRLYQMSKSKFPPAIKKRQFLLILHYQYNNTFQLALDIRYKRDSSVLCVRVIIKCIPIERYFPQIRDFTIVFMSKEVFGSFYGYNYIYITQNVNSAHCGARSSLAQLHIHICNNQFGV